MALRDFSKSILNKLFSNSDKIFIIMQMFTNFVGWRYENIAPCTDSGGKYQ